MVLDPAILTNLGITLHGVSGERAQDPVERARISSGTLLIVLVSVGVQDQKKV